MRTWSEYVANDPFRCLSELIPCEMGTGYARRMGGVQGVRAWFQTTGVSLTSYQFARAILPQMWPTSTLSPMCNLVIRCRFEGRARAMRQPLRTVATLFRTGVQEPEAQSTTRRRAQSKQLAIVHNGAARPSLKSQETSSVHQRATKAHSTL